MAPVVWRILPRIAKKQRPDAAPDLGDVQVTIVVTSGPRRRTLAQLMAHMRAKAAFAAVGLAGAAAVAAIILAALPGSHVVNTAEGPSAQPTAGTATSTAFGQRLPCLRLTIVSPDQLYARADMVGVRHRELAVRVQQSRLALPLPILFAAGMSLLDTIDGSLMNFAYGWAFSKPVRKAFYNITITGLSVAIALIVGTIELLGLAASQLNLEGSFWTPSCGSA